MLMIGLSFNFASVIEVSAQDYSSIIEHGQVYYLLNLYSKKYLEVNGNKAGASLGQGNFTGGVEQQFQFVWAEGIGEYAVYSIVPQANPKLRLNVDNASSKNGTKIKLLAESQQTHCAQQFQVKSDEYGFNRVQIFSMVSENTEMALGLEGPSKRNSAPLQIWEYIKASNQKWRITPVNEMNPGLAIPDSPAADDALSMYSCQSVIPLGTPGIKLAFANKGRRMASVDDGFMLEKKQGDSWSFYHADTYFTNLTAHDVPPGEINFLNILFSDFTDYPLTVGEYRVVKTYNSHNRQGLDGSLSVTAEFSVVDDGAQVKNTTTPKV